MQAQGSGGGSGTSATGQITSASILCPGENEPHPPSSKKLTFSGIWSGVTAGEVVVGCYKAIYPPNYSSAPTYYSPGAGIGQPDPTANPGGSNGTEVVWLPLTMNGIALYGVHVWLERGFWSQSNGFWYWNRTGILCLSTFYYNPGGSCFAAGTHVMTPQGWQAIENLSAGDQVLASDRNNPFGLPIARRIERVDTGRQTLLDILVGGRTLQATPNHPIMTRNRGWVPAAGLEVGDQLLSHNHRRIDVQKSSLGSQSSVYNLVIDGDSSYFIGRPDWNFSIRVADSCTSVPLTNDRLANHSPTIKPRTGLNGLLKWNPLRSSTELTTLLDWNRIAVERRD